MPLGFFLVDLSQHIFRPLIGQRDFFDDLAYFFEQALFPKVFSLIAETALVCASVVVMSFLEFGGDGAPATSAAQETGEWKRVFSLPRGSALEAHHFLRFVEQSLTHNWLERAGEQLAIHADHTVVDVMPEHLLDVGHRQYLALPRAKTEASEFIAQ
ncbi:MAG: hypothetical protein AAB489_04890 [Patescibacteria group bacterium]